MRTRGTGCLWLLPFALASLLCATSLAGGRLPQALANEAPEAGAQLATPVDEQVFRAPIAPGIATIAVRRLDGEGWLDLFAVVADLDTPGVDAGVLTPGHLTAHAPVSHLAASAGAVAAINSDFFHAGTSGAPVGLVVKDGLVWKSPYAGGRPTLGVYERPDGLRAVLGYFAFDARMCSAAPAWPEAGAPECLRVDALNEPAVVPGQIAVFDELWGEAALPLARWSPSEVAHARLSAVAGSDGAGEPEWQVTSAGRGVPKAPPGKGEMVALGWRDGATRLESTLREGTRWRWSARAALEMAPGDSPPAGRLKAAISGGALILKDGRVVADLDQPGYPLTQQPRSAVGVSRDGRRLILAAVDGRQTTSRGMDVLELAEWLARLGASDAMNLDGGGSTTLCALLSGDEPVVLNSPSDGRERPVPLALGLFFHPSTSGMPGSFVLKPAFGPALLDRGSYPLGPAGLVAAAGVPARVMVYPSEPAERLLWTVDPPDLGLFPQPGVFVALRPGKGRIVALKTDETPLWSESSSLFVPPIPDPVASAATAPATLRASAASIPVEAVGTPVRLRIDPDPLVLVPGEPAAIQAMVYDAQGQGARVGPGAITFWLAGGVEGSVRDGRVTANPFRTAEPPTLEARYLELKASVPIVWATAEPAQQPAGAPAVPPEPADVHPGDGVRVLSPHEGEGAQEPFPGPMVAVFGSLPPLSTAPEWARWLSAGPRLDLVVAVARPSDPSRPLADQAEALLASGLPVAGSIPGPAAGTEQAREFVRLFGAPNSVATRGDGRFLMVDPESVAWEWVAQEIRRARSHGLRRLFVVLPGSPHRPGSSREERMLAGWLSLAARQGMEAWAMFPAGEFEHRMIDGVHSLALPPLQPEGPVVVLTLAPQAVQLQLATLDGPTWAVAPAPQMAATAGAAPQDGVVITTK